MIRVFLVDDQTPIRRGLKMRLALEPDLLVVGEAAGEGEAMARATTTLADVIIINLDMSGQEGLATTRSLHALLPGAALIVLGLHDDFQIRRQALAAGATAFVSKHDPVDILLKTIRQAADEPHEEDAGTS